MNNNIKFCLLFMTISFFLTSCGSSFSVTKRQHNKGYFVSSSKNYSTSSEKEKVAHQNEFVTNEVSAQIAEISATKTNSHLQKDYAEANTSSGIDKTTVSKAQPEKATNLDLTTVNSDKEEPRTLKSAKNKITSSVTTTQDRHRDRDKGLSLLWIIIIVLLILWALGLIGGFGSSGLLHLLLVIALILLILWLLRII